MSKYLFPRPRGGIPVRTLITEGLGYCCSHLFFTLFPSTSVAARRLGCTIYGVKKEKRRAREGCAGCEGCQLAKLPALERAVRQRPDPSNDLPQRTRPANPPVESPVKILRSAKGDREEDD